MMTLRATSDDLTFVYPSAARMFTGGLLMASVFAVALHVAKANGILEAICAAVPNGSPEWILFGCYFL